ncbi:MAG: RNA polymerase sigma factor [Fimbriimonadaceae bacterium]|nr:RNA polymerase sigma factor [Fimbriimonadaceae bacterium]
MDADVQLAQRGDREAMGRIVDMYYDAVFAFCARSVGRELAQDASQETFLTAQGSIKRFRGDSSLKTWLFGIAHNHCRSALRKQRCESVDWIMELHGIESPEASVINREVLRTALKRLSPEHREVVLLHEIEGLKYEEIAQVIGVPIGTVKSRLHHAFLNLRTALFGAEEVMA